jgi:predicted alpha/beta hydrolase
VSEAPPGLSPASGAKVHGIANAVDFPSCTVPAEFFEAPAGRGAFLLLPAMGTPARYYRPFAEACAGVGFHVFLPELPGTGSSTPGPSRSFDYGYRELVDAWAVPLVKAVRNRLGRLPLVLLGHSLGAHVGMLASLQDRADVDALVTLAGGNIHYRNWGSKGAHRVRLVAWLVTGLGYPLGYVPGQYLGLGGPQARSLMREWGQIIRTGQYDHVADALAPSAPVPSLCLGYEGDFMAPRKSVASMARMLGGDLEWLPVDWPGNPHASWARHPDETLRVIEDWLAKQRLVAER